MKTKTLFSSALAAILSITGASISYAQSLAITNDVPKTISYQGILTDNAGTPLPDGTYRITLSLYADPTGSIKVWQDSYDAALSKGIFNLYLGDGDTPLPDPATMNTPLWVGTQVGDSPLMYPLTPLSASPYALNVPDRAITTGKLADGAVTADKVSMDYVRGIAVNGQPITTQGSLLNIEGSEDIALNYDNLTNTLRLSRPMAATEGDREKSTSVQGTTFDFWTMRGDGRTDNGSTVTPVSGDWLGTSNNVTFEMRTYGQTAMRYQPNGTYAPNIIGGSSANSVTASLYGGVIGGGHGNTINNSGIYAFIGSGNGNTASSENTVIAGGRYNIAVGGDASIGGGYENTTTNDFATVAGGGYNEADLAAAIGGGVYNKALNYFATIAGGDSNIVQEINGTIGGGHFNQVEAEYGSIGGGQNNVISTGAVSATIGGGQYNTISSYAERGVIGGGSSNLITDVNGTVGGGTNNEADDAATVGGGVGNTASEQFSTIGGGYRNTASEVLTTVGGGNANIASGASSTVGGGHGNMASGIASTTAGGGANIASGDDAAIGGGYGNLASASYTTVAGGNSNEVQGTYSIIGGGKNNEIESPYGFIGGGESNAIGTSYSNYSVIGGGSKNGISGWGSTIGGGERNLSAKNYTTIGGGYGNDVSADLTTIGGGGSNRATSLQATVGGGTSNTASAVTSTIGGGEGNFAQGRTSTIPGGDNLQTTGYAQTSVGFFNASRGTMASRPNRATIVTTDDPLLMVGNGDGTIFPAQRSNAFEVSYNGHSVVYDVNGATRTPIKGATYVDNVVYAWGDINGNGTINAEFGISSVTYMGAGTYLIRIEVNDPQTGAPVVLNNASITTTAVQEGVDPGWLCFAITTTRIGNPGPNQFIIRVKNSTTCALADTPFMFKVTGRP